MTWGGDTAHTVPPVRWLGLRKAAQIETARRASLWLLEVIARTR